MVVSENRQCRQPVNGTIRIWKSPIEKSVIAPFRPEMRVSMDCCSLDGDAAGVAKLSDRLGVGERHLRRLFLKHLGASPIAVAQTRRVLFAVPTAEGRPLQNRPSANQPFIVPIVSPKI